jgi:hypothetical protein
MDLNDLKKSVVTCLGVLALVFVVVQGVIFLAVNCSPTVLLGLLFLVFFGLGVKIDYERRQFNKTLRK